MTLTAVWAGPIERLAAVLTSHSTMTACRPHPVTGGTKLATTTPAKEEAKSDSAPAAPVRDETQAAAAAALGEKEVEPVGQEYIEEIKNEEGQSAD